jgi:arylsulfatase A-like enzyme
MQRVRRRTESGFEVPAARLGITVLLLIAALGASGCGAHYIRAAAPPTAVHPRPDTSLTQHVVLVSIDGLRPDAIATFNAPTLKRLIDEGASTLSASTILPSKTLPSHTSMLTGQPPDRHGVLWNNVATADADTIELPNIFSVARSHGYRTAAFFSKAKFGPLQREGTLDYSQAPGGWFGKWYATRTVNDVANYLKDARPNLLFVHLSDVDAAGHKHGWMSPEYGRSVLAADAGLKRLIALADEAFGAGNFTLIVTADHGGHGSNHGSDDPRDVTIPWITWGKGVKPGRIGTAVKTMDTAATVLWLLGIEAPEDWAGKPVTEPYARSSEASLFVDSLTLRPQHTHSHATSTDPAIRLGPSANTIAPLTSIVR